jgi:hypothetical protein
MATLTWHNVDAPDFRTSLEGYQTFSKLLDNAFRGANEGINTFDASLNEKANTAVIAAAMRERDPEAYQAALASGQFVEGVDPRRVSAQTYAALNSQASSLLNQATQSQQLGDMKYASDQGKAFDQLGDEYQQIESLRRTGTPKTNAEADRLMASLRPQLDAVGTRNTMGFIKGLNDSELFGVDLTGRRQEQTLAGNRDRRDETRLGYEGQRVGFERSRLNMEEGRYNWEVSDRNDIKSGQDAFMKMRGRSMDRETALSAFSSPEFQNLTPGAKMYALQQLNNNNWGNIYTPDQLGAAAGFSPTVAGANTGAGPSDPTRVMNYQARAAGFSAVPDSVRTLGSASDFAVQVNRAGVDSSAMGTYQIVGQTMRNYGPRVFGKNWRNIEFNQENQDKIARAIFNDNRGSADALRKQWVSLNPAEAERVRQMPWEQARQIIAAKESGASTQQVRGGSPVSIATGAQLRAGQEGVNKTPASKLLASAANNAGVQDVVASLRQGKFANTSQAFLKERLDEIVRHGRTSDGRYTINYAQAGDILNSSLTENNNSWGITNWLSGNSVRVGKDGWRLNNDRIDQEVQRFRSGGISRDLDREQGRQADVQGLGAATNQLAAARQAYQAALMRVPVQPGLRAELPRLQARMQAAQAAYDQVSSGVERRNAPNVQPSAREAPSVMSGEFWKDLVKIRRVN